jgi:hypothetical protein
MGFGACHTFSQQLKFRNEAWFDALHSARIYRQRLSQSTIVAYKMQWRHNERVATCSMDELVNIEHAYEVSCDCPEARSIYHDSVTTQQNLQVYNLVKWASPLRCELNLSCLPRWYLPARQSIIAVGLMLVTAEDSCLQCLENCLFVRCCVPPFVQIKKLKSTRRASKQKRSATVCQERTRFTSSPLTPLTCSGRRSE